MYVVFLIKKENLDIPNVLSMRTLLPRLELEFLIFHTFNVCIKSISFTTEIQLMALVLYE